MSRPVIVGESPLRQGFDPRGRANVAFVRGDSSIRLAKLLGVERSRMALHFRMINLSRAPGEWSARDAAFLAWTLMEVSPRRTFILCGRRVASAFGVGAAPYFAWSNRKGHDVVVVPHPSGKSHWWNNADNRELAADFFRKLARMEGLT